MNHHLLERYFQGRCNAEERAQVENWLDGEEELPVSADLQKTSAGTENEWIALNERILANSNRLRIAKRWYLAASVIFLTSIALYYVNSYRGRQTEGAVIWKTINVANGHSATLILSDGSVIELNGGSSFAYIDHFAQNRDVKLYSGEAFFSITKDPAHPFIVHTRGRGQIKVLGTRFNVKNNLFRSSIEISLNSGKINFSCNHQTTILQPGQQLSYHLTDRSVSSPKAIDTLTTAVWRQGTLLFRDTPIQEVFNEMEQHFGVRFISSIKGDNLLFTAELRQETLQQALNLIQKSTDLRFNASGTDIYVYKR